MSRLAITDDDLPDDFEVDLWGQVYELMPVGRTLQRELEDLDRQFKAIDEDADDATDQAVAVLAQIIDCQLKRTKKNQPTAGELITKRWEGDELRSGQLQDFAIKLADAQRPT